MKHKNLLPAIAIMLMTTGLHAQNPIKGSTTDEKFANTTVVYKDSAATDLTVLSNLDNSLGVGDIVRITVAPPKPAPAPKIATRPTIQPARNNIAQAPAPQLVASSNDASFLFTNDQNKSSDTVASEARSAKTAEVQQIQFVAERPLVQAQIKSAPANNSAAVSTAKVKSVASGKSVKSSKKSKKPSGWSMSSKKYKKKGTQRYGCYKF